MSDTVRSKALLMTTAISALSFIGTSLTLGVCTTAVGQETLDDVIYVTAEKRAKSLQDTQISAVVLSGDSLDKNAITDLEEALLRVGNADISVTGDLSIRGIRKQGPTGGITTNRMVVGYYVDGVALSAQAQRFATSNWDIDQVEILRGPVTTVQGRNALGGGVLITSANPEFEWSGKLRASYGEYNTYQLAGALTGPIVEDQMAFRVAIDHNSSDGYATNITRQEDDAGRYDFTTVRGKVLLTPSSLPDFSGTLTISHTAADRAGSVVKIVGPSFGNRHTISAPRAISEADGVSLFALNLGYDLTDEISFRSVTAYQISDVTNDTAFQETDVQSPQRTAFGVFDDKMLSQELLLTFDYDRLTVLTGAYYASIKNEQQRGATISGSLVSSAFAGTDGKTLSTVSEEITNYAGFVDLSFTANEWLELNAGIRVDRDENSFSRSSEGLTIPSRGLVLFPPLPGATVEKSETEILPKVGIVASFTDDVSLGLSYARGYRPGGSGVNLTEVVRTGQPDFFEYGSESTDNYEISLRSQWFERAFTVNANAYLIDWKDQQVNVLGPLGSSFDDATISNGGSSTVRGLEIEAFGSVGNLDLFTSIGLSDTEFDSFIVNGTDFGGLEFSRSPQVSGAVGASYTFTNGLFLSGTVNHVGSSFQNNENTIELPDYTITNITASYDLGPVNIFAYTKNVFDVEATGQLFTEGLTEFRRLRAPRHSGIGVNIPF